MLLSCWSRDSGEHRTAGCHTCLHPHPGPHDRHSLPCPAPLGGGGHKKTEGGEDPVSFSSHAHQRPRKINWRGWGSRVTAVTMETPCHSPWRAARCFGNQEKVNSASEEENRRVRAHRPLAPPLGCSLFPPGCSLSTSRPPSLSHLWALTWRCPPTSGRGGARPSPGCPGTATSHPAQTPGLRDTAPLPPRRESCPDDPHPCPLCPAWTGTRRAHSVAQVELGR